MEKRPQLGVILAFCIAFSLVRDANGAPVFPDYNNVDCLHGATDLTAANSLTHALANTSRSTNGSQLILQSPGCYRVRTFFLLSNITQFSIVGLHGREKTVISCANEVGLAFVNVRGLRIENVSIRRCGLRGEHVNSTTAAINRTVNLFHRVPPRIGYALIMADCEGVQLTNVTVEDTFGIGVMGINIVGTSAFTGLEITRNRPSLCFFTQTSQFTSDSTIGGGMYILYHDYVDRERKSESQLFITGGHFRNNSYCASFSIISSYYQQSITAAQFGYTIGSASALGITLAQLRYAVNVSITDSYFTNNTAWIGGSVAINVFENVMDSRVDLSNCHITNNGFADYQLRPLGVSSQGSGLAYINNLIYPDEDRTAICDQDEENRQPSSVLVKNSVFSNNTAYLCAAVIIRSLTGLVAEEVLSYVTFSGCLFEHNLSPIAPVLCSAVGEPSADTSNLRVVLNDVIVRENIVASVTAVNVGSIAESSGQMALQSTDLYITGNSSFVHNEGVVIVSSTSFIHFQGNAIFEGNSGVFGGALRLLIGSYIIIHNNSKTQFIKNSATVQGGAIFYSFGENAAFYRPYDCFVFFEYVDVLCNYSSCPSIQELSFHMSFINNFASTQGGTIYGSTLSSCPWFGILKSRLAKDKNDITGIDLLALLDAKFTFEPYPNSTSVISTNAVSIHMDSNFTTTNLKQPLVLAAPGERVYLDISATDGFQRDTSTVVASSSSSSSIVSTALGNTNFWFVSPSSNNASRFQAPITILGLEGSSSDAAVYSTSSFAELQFRVTILPCGFGFRHESTTGSCICIPQMVEQQVQCNVETQELVVPSGKWVGPLINSSTPAVSNCFYDYCRLGMVTFRADNLDYQCNIGYNRTGLLCGSCQPNTSAVLGTSRCRPDCRNYGLLWIPALLVAGAIIVALISFLGLTITDGYLNGFIFYCNCLNYFSIYLSTSTSLDHILIPVAWANLNLGIESCFYIGMSTLARISLRLLFPFYLLGIMVVIIILAKYFTIFTRLRFSGSQTFATLLLLCYINITGTCIELLGFAKLTGVYSNTTYYGWLLEPAVPYGQGWHGLAVFIAASLVVIYVLPFPILLLFPQLLYRLHFFHRFKPLLDAFWAPFKPRLQFWLGFRALLRLIPFCLASYLHYPNNVLGLIIFISLVLYIQERLSPFEGYLRNGFDTFFLLNLVLLGVGNIFFNMAKEYKNDEELRFPIGYRVMADILLCSSYIAFLAIATIQFLHRYPSLRDKLRNVFQRTRNWLLRQKLVLRKMLSGTKRDVIDTTDQLSDTDEKNRVVLTNIVHRSSVNISELREPLLED